MTPSTDHLRYSTCGALILLIFLCILWEGWLAPLRPGGSWLILKGAVLLLPLFGILRGKRYTYKWLSLLIQFYLLEGLLRATSEHGPSQLLALLETVLALIVFIACIAFVRRTRASNNSSAS
ncbi:DUF2069 domain-containing protein [Azonexus sp.]|uniref:DUF2069 domain-containing protein n=1 Tax=Azonexus sp. TaxID=1872668 RepID=UPI0039E68F4A